MAAMCRRHPKKGGKSPRVEDDGRESPGRVGTERECRLVSLSWRIDSASRLSTPPGLDASRIGFLATAPMRSVDYCQKDSPIAIVRSRGFAV
jgi:hypothetical protein